jgi:hypothetical protein
MERVIELKDSNIYQGSPGGAVNRLRCCWLRIYCTCSVHILLLYPIHGSTISRYLLPVRSSSIKHEKGKLELITFYTMTAIASETFCTTTEANRGPTFQQLDPWGQQFNNWNQWGPTIQQLESTGANYSAAETNDLDGANNSTTGTNGGQQFKMFYEPGTILNYIKTI